MPAHRVVSYVIGTSAADSPFGAATFRGHEFHYSDVVLDPETKFAYELDRGIGIRDKLDGAVVKNTLGSYTHLHPVASSGMFARFVESAAAGRLTEMAPGFDPAIIAPCGINCGACRAHLRPKLPCPGAGVSGRATRRPAYPARSVSAGNGPVRFVFPVRSFPAPCSCGWIPGTCTRYGISEIGNLECIRDKGLEKFLEGECRKWVSGNGIICVHDREWYPVVSRD